MQTAVGVFGCENFTDGASAPPLMVENAGNSVRAAISSLRSPPFLAVEACRERLVSPFIETEVQYKMTTILIH
jgi:hypothetical protein